MENNSKMEDILLKIKQMNDSIDKLRFLWTILTCADDIEDDETLQDEEE